MVLGVRRKGGDERETFVGKFMFSFLVYVITRVYHFVTVHGAECDFCTCLYSIILQ